MGKTEKIIWVIFGLAYLCSLIAVIETGYFFQSNGWREELIQKEVAPVAKMLMRWLGIRVGLTLAPILFGLVVFVSAWAVTKHKAPDWFRVLLSLIFLLWTILDAINDIIYIYTGKGLPKGLLIVTLATLSLMGITSLFPYLHKCE